MFTFFNEKKTEDDHGVSESKKGIYEELVFTLFCQIRRVKMNKEELKLKEWVVEFMFTQCYEIKRVMNMTIEELKVKRGLMKSSSSLSFVK